MKFHQIYNILLLIAVGSYVTIASGLDPAKCKGPRYGTLGGLKCLAFMPKWEFNTETNTCQEFIYGGCPGM